MTSLTQDLILTTLRAQIDPITGLDLAATLAPRGVHLPEGGAPLTLDFGYAVTQRADLVQQIEQALAQAGAPVQVRVNTRIVAHAVQQGMKPLPGVANIIAVASGKGGVGKSTVSVNLALALAAQGARTAILDADIYGPSVPAMLGLSGKPEVVDGKFMRAMSSYGVGANSIGFLIDADAPAIWRGPMVTQALEQLLRQTQWGDLDYLIIDMPPGTGDIALTLAQKVPVVGAVIVTTPQDIALLDARKGLAMFQKVNVPVLGIVENMAMHVCTQCGHVEHIFGQGGGQRMAEQYGVPLLGQLPLTLSLREQMDQGRPAVAVDPQGVSARIFGEIATRVAGRVAALPRDMAGRLPDVVVAS